MQDLSRTLVKTLLKQVNDLHHVAARNRLRQPVIIGFWGQGGKVPRRNIADRLLAAFPKLHNASGLESVLSQYIQPNIDVSCDDSDQDDFESLRRVLLALIRDRTQPVDREELDLWIQQGFEAHRALAEQHDLWLGSAITETGGLYVDATSVHHPLAAMPNPNSYMFAYSLVRHFFLLFFFSLSLFFFSQSHKSSQTRTFTLFCFNKVAIEIPLVGKINSKHQKEVLSLMLWRPRSDLRAISTRLDSFRDSRHFLFTCYFFSLPWLFSLLALKFSHDSSHLISLSLSLSLSVFFFSLFVHSGTVYRK